jgi:hypothetical protein
MAIVRHFVSSAILTFVMLSSGAAQEPQAPVPAQYSANAIGQSGTVAGKSFGLNVYIDAVSPEGQVDELIEILRQKGQDGLVSALEKSKDVGRIAPVGSVGTTMRVVLINPRPDGGQHIVLATNRPIAFGELYNGTRSRDYPIGILVLNVDGNGKGTGTFAPLCKVKFNKKKELVVEHYGQKPFRVVNVTRQK